MRTLGNILWHIPFLGFVTATLVWLLGLLLTVTVIAAPIGLGLMELGKFLFVPFGHAMISKDDLSIEQNPLWRAYSTIVMILYLPFGLIFLVLCVIQVVGLALTIVGIPAALVIAKSLGTVLNPVDKVCVTEAAADEVARRKGRDEIGRRFGA